VGLMEVIVGNIGMIGGGGVFLQAPNRNKKKTESGRRDL